MGRWRGQKTDGTGETPSTRRAAIGASGSRSWQRVRAYLRRSEWSRQNGRRRTLARAAASNPLRCRVSTNRALEAHDRVHCAPRRRRQVRRPKVLSFTRRRRQRRLAPCPPSDARTVHEASATAAARLPGVTGGRIDEASCARRRRGHHVECPRTPQTSLGPGSASALRSAKVASWQSRRRRLVPADRRSRPTGCDSRRWRAINGPDARQLRCCTWVAAPL